MTATPSESSLRVLVIEDDEVDRIAVVRMLKKIDPSTEVAEAATLHDGIAALRHDDLDCALVDFRLPDGDGLDFLRVVRNLKEDRVPVIFLTGMDDNEQALALLKAGAEDYLIKSSVEPASLGRAVRYAVERHRIRRQLHQDNTELKEKSTHDPLTGLLNRNGLEQAVVREGHRVDRHGGELIAVLIDLDDFKRVNDELGHAAGDELLCAVSGAIRNAVRATDVVSRIGGDEFLVVLCDTTAADAVAVADKVRGAIRAAGSVAPWEVTASAGVGSVPGEVRTTTEIVSWIQAALHASKNEGKDRTTWVGSEPAPRAAVAPSVARPDDGGPRVVGYAPAALYALADKAVVGHELMPVLDSGPVASPSELYFACRTSAQRARLDVDVLDAALRACRLMPPGERVHLHLFPSTLMGDRADEALERIASRGAGTALFVHLSSRLVVGDPMRLRAPIERLREAGAGVILDGIQLGRMSLEVVIVLEPDAVRIDHRWVAGLTRHAWKQRVLRRMVLALKTLDTDVIAEGVASESDLRCLLDAGVRLGQGGWLDAHAEAMLERPRTGSVP